MKVSIAVTQEDIDAGIPKEKCLCPVATALQRELPPLPDKMWLVSYWTVCLSGTFDDLGLEQSAHDWITDFDAGNEVRPMRFSLDLPQNLLKFIEPAALERINQ